MPVCRSPDHPDEIVNAIPCNDLMNGRDRIRIIFVEITAQKSVLL
jgi:hypothetical protein